MAFLATLPEAYDMRARVHQAWQRESATMLGGLGSMLVREGIGHTDHPLRQRIRPRFEEAVGPAVRVVDLFSGGGGLTLGVAQAVHAAGLRIELPLVVDLEFMATEVYRANFPFAQRVETASVEDYFDGALGGPLSFVERRVKTSVGKTDLLVGGPPCQGHSNLNNHTRRTDSKNALYLRMVRAAEVLQPDALLIENVPAVLRDRHDGEGVVARAVRHLESLGFRVAHAVLEIERMGLAQSRRRHVLLALRGDECDPAEVLVRAAREDRPKDLRWAIGDLADCDDGTLRDRRPVAQPVNLARMQWMLDNDRFDLPNELRPPCHQNAHSYKSMYGRLRWDRPAQTITSGYGSIGQGRFMHPDLPRALTAHEAARIQGFPDHFDFSSCPTRSALATMIGNAVPPPLGKAVVQAWLQGALASGSPADPVPRAMAGTV